MYTRSPDDKSLTVCKREAWISSSIYGLSRALQSFGLERFKVHSGKALAGYNYVLTSMYSPELLPLNAMAVSKLEKITEAAKLNKDKLKHTAQKAREIAKSKSVSVAMCESAEEKK